ncbi:MAG: ribonuclease VapC12 [Gemmatimonadales bacterium]|nr:Ribonuclease VapC9 [bacterium HR33]GIW50993.1 MAG: ribonuclease VapC12 [Gemmatimonadales bacterium]
MIVLDASAALELLLGTPAAGAVEARIVAERSLHSPAVIDLEVTQAVRRFCASGQVGQRRGRQVIEDLYAFPVRRYPHTPLLGRIWELRRNLTAYDAAYVALAEVLDAPLVTRDARLARATGHKARIELV